MHVNIARRQIQDILPQQPRREVAGATDPTVDQPDVVAPDAAPTPNGTAHTPNNTQHITPEDFERIRQNKIAVHGLWLEREHLLSRASGIM